MLSIGKLAGGQEGYYLQAVARGVEDYYVGSGEAPGRWLGAGCADLRLAGRVDAEALRAVLDARNPASAQRSLIICRRPDRVTGYDLTFSAPKGVSLLFALADPGLSLTVRRAHDAAVAATLGYLEREAGEVRRGRDGMMRLPRRWVRDGRVSVIGRAEAGGGPAWLLDVVEGRSGEVVTGWLDERGAERCAQVRVAALDSFRLRAGPLQRG